MTHRNAGSAALVLGLLTSLAHPAKAIQGDQPGWIGISYEARPARDGRAERVVVTEVRPGSPAQSAGIRAGDRLLAIDDLTRPDEMMHATSRLSLHVGQLVSMQIGRDGRTLDMRVRAARRPIELYTEQAIGLAFRTDSMVETMFRAMDSLRVHLIEANDREVRSVSRTRQSTPATPVAPLRGREAVSAPFEFFVFRSEQHDSLVREMDELNGAMETLRERERERLGELRRARRGQGDVDRDQGLAELRQAMERLRRQSATLRSAMAEAARATAGWQYLLPSAPETPPEPPAPRAETYRPLTPYLLGSNRVAGAQVIEVQPELGTYFGVEGGVLVIDVSPGTPAAIAGLRPGDVVTRLDQVGVRTVEDLRFGVSQAGDTLPVTLIRRGASVQVLLRRR